MQLSVKGRIAVAMTIVVVANAAAAAFGWFVYSQAAAYNVEARAASQRARLAAQASQRTTEFVSDAADLAFVTGRSTVSYDRSSAYGSVLGSEKRADGAIRSLAGAFPGERSRRIVRRWDDLRLVTYGWVNAEGARVGSPLRIRRMPDGGFRAGASAQLDLPPAYAAMDANQLRRAVRDAGDLLRNADLRTVAAEADAASREAAARADSAATLAMAGTAGLVLASLLLAVGMAVWLYRTIATPLQRARAVADRVAAGDLAAAFDAHSTDEIGALTHAVENMKETVVHKVLVMREMAGAVLVTADGVHGAADHALAEASRRRSEVGPALVHDISEVVARTDVLTGLATQMLEG